MSINEYLPFGIAEGANVLTSEEYRYLPVRLSGFTSGVAKSEQLNTVWRQSSVIASAVAQVISSNDENDILDDGDYLGVAQRLSGAISLLADKKQTERVKQTTGNSLLDVMSQDAVTRQIAALSNAISQVTIKTEGWTQVATAGQTVIEPPFEFESCLLIIDGLVQYIDSSYTIENNKIILANTPKLKGGEKIHVIVGLPVGALTQTPSVSINDAGIANTFTHPNFWFDDNFYRISKQSEVIDPINGRYYFSNANIQLNDNDGLPSITVSSKSINAIGTFAYNISAASLAELGFEKGKAATFGLRFIASNGGEKTGNDRTLVQQYRADDSEITERRMTISHPSASTPLFPIENYASFVLDEQCARVRIFFSVSSSFNSVTVDRFMLTTGSVTAYRPSYFRAISAITSNQSTTQSAVVSLSGSDEVGNGTADSPYKTVNKAIAALGGVGKVYISGGTRYGEQIDASKIIDIEMVGSDDATHNRTEFYFGSKLNNAVKTENRAKVYQCPIDIVGQPNHIWLDSVADIETKILPEHRHPLSRGREHRLWCTKIYATKAQQSTNAALNEIESARIPLCYYSTTEKVMYFSLPENINISTANVYVAMNNNLGLFNNVSNIWTPKGVLKMTNIHVRYGGVNRRGFIRSVARSCSVIGAPNNGFDVSWFDEDILGEACGCGSGKETNGDGFNATQKSDWVHHNIYAHDCNDDGVSSHQNCVEVGYSPVAEFNSGAGLCPSYGAQAIYHNPLTICNSVNERVNQWKKGGITCIQSPRLEDNGVITDCTVYGGVSIGDLNSYWDDGLDADKAAQLTTHDCVAINPIEYGFANQRAIDCKHSGTGTPKKDGVVSLTLTDI
ncbi:TPA: hypothetical protein ACKREO_002531 [Providencia stuartii]